MNLDPAPRQSKLIYLAIDAGLLITAFIIVFFAKDPYAPLPFVSAVLCVVFAAIIGFVPFLLEFIVDQREIVATERTRVVEQVQRLHTAGESLARAAAQIKAVEEAVHKTAHAAENLPYRMQEKLAEFNEALAEKDTEEREALERELDELRAANATNLKAVAEKIAKATTEWTAIESASRRQLTTAQEASTKLTAQLQSALAQLDSRIAALNHASAAAPVARSASPRELTPTPAVVAPKSNPDPMPPAVAPLAARAESAEPVIESVTFGESPHGEEPKQKKSRPPRKSKPEDMLAAMSAEPTQHVMESGAAETAPASNEDVSSATEEPGAKVESSASSDGATRLLVTAYIGIGNKLFIRGEGPGLSWDRGVPMQFVSIGKWGWASHEATAPVKCKLFKNDDTAALSGEVTLEPGKHVEVTALF
jgi:chemotaxis protein histidine kinase CheA